MDRIILDAETRTRFAGREVGAEVADEDGHVLGHFVPAGVFERIAETLFPPATKEQLAQTRREMLASGGVTTEELLAGFERIKREREARR